jgi:chromosome segregation ATPase
VKLQESIRAYVALRTRFKESEARALQIRQYLMPDCEKSISSARGSKHAAEQLLNKACCVEDVQAARAKVNEADQHLSDCYKLKDNLEVELRSWESSKDVLLRELTTARSRMFDLKYEELLESLNIPADQMGLLELAIAANHGATRSPRNDYALPINEKYGNMDGDRKIKLAENLLAEMTASVAI